MPKNVPTRKKSPARRTKPAFVHQFLVVLAGSDPLVWRRIQVPEHYNFWELHVAIQDAMGWQDCHLHRFSVPDPNTQALRQIGIPDPDFDDRSVVPGWMTPLAGFFSPQRGPAPPSIYRYDFGDDWEHLVHHESHEPFSADVTYPRCVAGEGRCPPEDSGGIHGYKDLLKTLADKKHPQHREAMAWTGGPIDPHEFDLAAVRFDDPMKRFEKAFGSADNM